MSVDFTKFALLSVFALKGTICLEVTPPPKNRRSLLPVNVRGRLYNVFAYAT